MTNGIFAGGLGRLRVESSDAGWAHYPTLETARIGAAILLHEERILRVMVVRNEVPPSFVEWQER